MLKIAPDSWTGGDQSHTGPTEKLPDIVCWTGVYFGRCWKAKKKIEKGRDKKQGWRGTNSNYREGVRDKSKDKRQGENVKIVSEKEN